MGLRQTAGAVLYAFGGRPILQISYAVIYAFERLPSRIHCVFEQIAVDEYTALAYFRVTLSFSSLTCDQAKGTFPPGIFDEEFSLGV